MDIQFYGANCFSFATRGVRVITDDNLSDLGAKYVTKPGDILLYTGAHGNPPVATKITVDGPGEYEVSDVSIYGIAARGHMDEAGTHNATMYKVLTRELNIFIPGHIYPELTDDQLEAIGIVDIMVVPVGGNGYTLDPIGALKLIKKIEPKIVIPSHYDVPGINYPVPQQDLTHALHEMAMERSSSTETTTKLRIKATDLTDTTQLIVVEKS